MPTASRVRRSPVFADAFAYIALLNPADEFHVRTIRQIENLTRRVVTTHWVLMEVADALCAPAYRVEVARFLRELAVDAGTEIIPSDGTLYENGLDLYARRVDKAWSLTDCLSFVVMTDRGLTDALTGDHHFEQAGFKALLRES